jgi:hypothetical protein
VLFRSDITLSPHTSLTIDWIARIQGSITASDGPVSLEVSVGAGGGSSSRMLDAPGSFSEMQRFSVTLVNGSDQERDFYAGRSIYLSLRSLSD